jgi:hypothetical protein
MVGRMRVDASLRLTATTPVVFERLRTVADGGGE